MEDYKQKYEKALARARVVNPGTKDYNIVTTIFPELKESEDERIRKEIIAYLDLKDFLTEGKDGDFKKWIDWLKNNPIFAIPKIKFKVGDWVIFNNDKLRSIYQVEKLENYAYTLRHILGGSMPLAFYSQYLLRPWTIEDANDGDILEFADHGRIFIGIVSYVNKVTGKVDMNCLLEGNNFKLGNYYNLDTIKPHPATKEQRDLLFQKMKEAGYKWNTDSKRLNWICD